MFDRRDNDGCGELLPGLRAKDAGLRRKGPVVGVRFGSMRHFAPPAHPCERIGYRVEGRLRIGGEKLAVCAGYAWRIPADVERGDQVF